MEYREAEYYARKQANRTEKLSYVIKKEGTYDFIHKDGLKDLLMCGWKCIKTVYLGGM